MADAAGTGERVERDRENEDAGQVKREPFMRAGFGLGRLHHLFSRADRSRVVGAALDAGFGHFDVAPAYGEGLAERELGRVLREAGARDRVTITTKFGIPFRAIGQLPMSVYFALRAVGKITKKPVGANYARRDFSPGVAVASLDASLRRLGTDRVDYLLVHEPLSLEEFRRLGDTWAELRRQRERGKVRRYGVSGEAEMILEAEREGLLPGEAVRMIPMCKATCELPREWFERDEAFVFNIVKYLRGSFGLGRIDTRVLVERVAQAMPACRPIFATNDVDEVVRMGAVLASIGKPGGSEGERGTGANR